MKKMYLLIAMATLCLSACNISYRTMYFSEFHPEEMNVDSVNIEEYEKKYGKYDGVILHNEYLIDQASNTLQYEYSLGRIRYVVLNPSTQWLTTLNLKVGNGNLTEAYVYIVYPDGKRKKFDIEDFKIDGEGKETTYKLAYPEIVKGTIIEESYEIERRLSPSVNNSALLQFSIPCESNLFQCGYHAIWKMQLKTDSTELQGLSVEDDEDNNKQVIKYRGYNIPAYVDEPYSSLQQENMRKIEFSYTAIRTRGSYFLGATSWGEISNKYADWAIREEPDDDIVEETLEIIKSASTDKEKLSSIVSHVQQNYKVVEQTEEDDVDEAFDDKQGTDEQICALTREMLQAANIPADMILMHSADDGKFVESYINLYEIRWPAVLATINGDRYLVFPYRKNYPIDLIPRRFQEQKALKVLEADTAQFVLVPSSNMANNTIAEQYKLKISDDGEIEVQEEKTLNGHSAYNTRETLAEMKADEIEKVLKGLLTYSEGDVKIISHEIINQNDYQKPLVIKLTYKIDNLVTITPDEIIFQTGGLFSPSSNIKWKVDEDERVNPIRIYSNEKYIKNIDIEFPKNWTLASTLKNLEQENKFGKIKGVYTVESGKIQVAQERLLLKSYEPKEAFSELLQITGRKSQLYIPTMIFKVN